jgi:DNA replication regulator DPB11
MFKPKSGTNATEGDTPLTGGSAADRPWTGLVVTFTGVEAKPALSMLVQDMGGTVESALTVKVTHVVASGTGSPKYLVSGWGPFAFF